jgi:hypothetical protein
MDFREMIEQLNPNLAYFLISSAVAYIAFALIAIWYVWPAIKDRPAQAALTPLLLCACLRVNGLMFLMPGLASPDLPRAFAAPTAYGDLGSAILALLTIACSGFPRRRGTPAPIGWGALHATCGDRVGATARYHVLVTLRCFIVTTRREFQCVQQVPSVAQPDRAERPSDIDTRRCRPANALHSTDPYGNLPILDQE